MNLPELESCEEKAIETVVSVINAAKARLGGRPSLIQLIKTRSDLTRPTTVPLIDLRIPIIANGERIIRDAIQFKWRLTDILMYSLKYLTHNIDDVADYYYFESVFSQPTEKYPVPQATASVYFTIQEKHLEPADRLGVPMMTFRVEGQEMEHDIRSVKLVPDWILAVLQMKINFFRRIETINLF